MPCKLGDELCGCNTREKQFCKNWEPGRGSKYFHCSRFIATRASCDKPPSACQGCVEHIEKLPRREGVIDWSDKDQVRERRRNYMKTYRRRAK